ncbi:ACT domain-containing protein [Colwellia marinimaniae]|nr:ACT domain-containing protein [Colwellia marinimaniae]
MDMQLEGEQGVRLAMHVESERAIELLTNQLDKLFDVIDCRVQA